MSDEGGEKLEREKGARTWTGEGTRDAAVRGEGV